MSASLQLQIFYKALLNDFSTLARTMSSHRAPHAKYSIHRIRKWRPRGKAWFQIQENEARKAFIQYHYGVLFGKFIR